MILAFVVLAALASVNYGANEAQKEKLTENAWYQKSKNYLETALTASTMLADFNLNKNLGYGQKIKDELATLSWQNISLGTSSPDNEPAANDSEPLDSNNEESVPILEANGEFSQDNIPNQESPSENTENNSSFWSDLGRRLKKEWQTSSPDEMNTNFNNFFTYQQTATGADMIFKTKNGNEYKLPLPFKFLGE